jgi:hypothetical protein
MEFVSLEFILGGGTIEETLSGEGGASEKTCLQVQQMFGY